MAQLAANGCNGWFGASWGAPMCEPEHHVPTPVGEKCLRCVEAIEEAHQGVTMTYVGRAGSEVVAEHVECFLRGTLGGALCHDGTCEHCGDGTGGAISDPPGLTEREAAIAAIAAFERKHGRRVL